MGREDGLTEQRWLIDVSPFMSAAFQVNIPACQHHLEAIYRAAGATEHLHLDLFPGNHAWGANKSTEFFGRYL
ncbi:MAG: hypothetical protein ACYDBB_25035 [Armatimonadota bacterium]